MTVVRPQSHRPIPRRRTALAGILAVGLLLTGMLALVDLLRHPLPDQAVELPPPEDDPRAEVVCPQERSAPGTTGDPAPMGGDPAPMGGDQTPVGVGSSDLYDCPETWHDRSVRYRGEAVGAILRRGDHAWVQLNDDVYSGQAGPLPAHREYRGGNAGVGVRIPIELAEQIERVGGPRMHGDIVEVVGTFRRIDPATREVAVIVAGDGEVVARGRPLSRPLLVDRAVAATVLALLAAAVVAAERVSVLRRR